MKAGERSWDGRVVGVAAFALTIAVNVASVGYTYGKTSTRVESMEVRVEKLETKVDAMQAVRIEIAGMKEQLAAINQTLQRLEKHLPTKG